MYNEEGKRLAGTAGGFAKSGPRKTTAREDRLFCSFPLQQSSTKPAHPESTRTVCRILSQNGLHGRIGARKPALNKKAKRMDAGKVDFSDEPSG